MQGKESETLKSVMSKSDHMPRSVLIISASDQFHVIVRRSITGFTTIDSRKSAAMARRRLLERDYDLVIIDFPLPDETGLELSLDAAERSNASVILTVPQDVYQDVTDRVVDHGILVLFKPLPRGRMDYAIRFMISMQSRIRRMEARFRSAQMKAEEIRIVSRAKILLVEKRHMTEDEAHRLINRQAMDHGMTRRMAAEKILDELM